MLQKFKSVISTLIFAGVSYSQIVTSSPIYPTENDSIIVFFDATQGNRGLLNYTGDVYAHTGVITNLSTRPSDWRYVITPWPGSGGIPNLPKNKLTRVSTNLYKLVIGRPREYYVDHTTGAHIQPSEKILKLAFVFRNADGTKEGKDVGNADIFLPLYQPGVNVMITEPAIDLTFGDPYRTPFFTEYGDTLTIRVKTATLGTAIDSISLFLDDSFMAGVADSVASFLFDTRLSGYGSHLLSAIATDTAGLLDTAQLVIMVNPPVKSAVLPDNIKPGINYQSNSVTLCLQAPRKNFIYVIGDFNDWRVDTCFFMQRDDHGNDDVYWWLTIPALNPDEEYAFQYLVDGSLRIADPYTEKVLDGWNDQYISAATYPNLKPYPLGKTKDPVGVIKINRPFFQWSENNYTRPLKHELVIYELLVRDFLAAHDYATLKDTLNYLANLGINAIELMPITEFEGNSSWGYMPSFYFAPDKYYGTDYFLKEFVQACHQRGIAVIMDIVLNHSGGQSPLVRLYWDYTNNRPAADNPWYNPTDRHPYGVGYDFNHESTATHYFAKRVLEYWLNEYHIDGYRFDMSKGFTQKYTYGNISAWNAYDASRIAILNGYANHIWSIDSTAYVILEHFSDNQEEKELAEYGMLLWGNMTHDYQEAAMGWGSDLSWSYYSVRQWTKPHLMTYLESHDEERLMYKNLQWGNAAGNYNIKQLATALNRIKLVAAFFFTLPGPKMFYQFGELGYDISIDNPCRTCEKPIHWEYFYNAARRNLYKTYAALLKLRRENEVFRQPNQYPVLSLNGFIKTIALSGNPNVVIVGNFGVTSTNVTPAYHHGGKWYDYFSGDSIYVEGNSATFTLQPGEFRIYTDRKLATPEPGILSDIISENSSFPTEFHLYPNHPNPFNSQTVIRYDLDRMADVRIAIVDLLGREVFAINQAQQPAGKYSFTWQGIDNHGEGVQSGIYFVLVERNGERRFCKITLLK